VAAAAKTLRHQLGAPQGAPGHLVAVGPCRRVIVCVTATAIAFGQQVGCRYACIVESMSASSTLDQLVARVRALMPEIRARYHVEHVALFGSYIHNRQSPDSDLDILVSFREVPSLLTFIELEDFLSDSLEVKVDLVMEDALKPNIGRRIRKDLLPI
jgi:predicted nucleotidyltransferase